MKKQIKKLLDTFNVSYKDFGNRLTGKCPIHNGDNNTAFSIYTETGVWRCFTSGCHENNNGVIGLTRLLLNKHKPTSYNEAKDFLEKLTSIKVNFSDDTINYSFLVKEKEDKKISRKSILSKLNIPSQYFVQDRGFSEKILIKYDIGNCTNKNSKYYNRAIVPIYDLDQKFAIGFTCRAIDNREPKWLHSSFNRDQSLYNSWFAKTEIAKTNTCVLVESPGNIWRLEESGIHCGLAMYGTQISFGQMRLLSKLGVLNLVIALDNDDAGKKATASIVEKLKGLYNIVIPKIEYSDIAECPKDYITGVFQESLNKFND